MKRQMLRMSKVDVGTKGVRRLGLFSQWLPAPTLLRGKRLASTSASQNERPSHQGALNGIKVIDLSRVLAVGHIDLG